MPDEKLSDVLGSEKKPPVVDKVDPTSADFTAEEYVKHVGYMEMISTRASEPIRRMWDRAWGLYNNSYDFSMKAQWQSKNYIPRINMTVRAATFMVKKALLGPAKTFAVQGIGDFGKMVAYYMDKITVHHLEEAKYVTNITDSLHAGMLSHLMVLKVYPVYVNEESVYFTDPTPKPVMNFLSPVEVRQYRRLKVRIDPCDPYNIHLDPTGQNKYVIHDITMDLYDLVELAKDKASGFDLAEVMKIQEDFTKSTTENPNAQPEYRSGQAPETSEQRRARTVLVQEYWGDVWTTDGKLVARNVQYTIANKKYLIKKPIYPKLPKGARPFIIAPVIRKPFSVWHQGFAEVVAGLQIMMTELMNLTLDANLFSSAKAFELDVDQVYDPLEFIQGITPGKTFKKRGGGFNTAPMIREVQIGNVAPQALAIFQQLDREFQSGVGLNEFAAPSGRTGSRTTATEVIEKSQSASTFMEEIARTIEEGVFEPLLEMIFNYVTMYELNFNNPHMIELFGAEGASKLSVFMQNPAFRKAMQSAPVKFKAHGVSAMAGKMRELEKISMLSKILAPYPELQQRIDPDKILRKMMESMAWYPEDILKDLNPNGPMLPVPASMAQQLPAVPTAGMGDFLGNAQNGMNQVPALLNSLG